MHAPQPHHHSRPERVYPSAQIDLFEEADYDEQGVPVADPEVVVQCVTVFRVPATWRILSDGHGTPYRFETSDGREIAPLIGLQYDVQGDTQYLLSEDDLATAGVEVVTGLETTLDLDE